MMFVMDVHPTRPEPMPFAQALQLLDELEAAVKARRDADLRIAAILARLHEGRGWEAIGVASVGEVGERHGLPSSEARSLCELGRAVRLNPLLEKLVSGGRITVAAGSIVAEVLADPRLLHPDDDWLGWAEREPTSALRRRVRRRKEEIALCAELVLPFETFVSLKGRDDFDRARIVASRRAGRSLTRGETLETVVDHYLDTFDENRVRPGERRCLPTEMVDGRYVPIAVRREIYERQGQRCAVPMCEHTTFLEKAHVVAHASGGDREADNLVLLCSLHHLFLDVGTISMSGTAAEPKFFDALGRDFAQRYEPGGIFGPVLRPQPANGTAELDSRSRPPSEAADPPGADPPATLPQAAAPQAADPQMPAPQMPAPQATDPRSGGSAENLGPTSPTDAGGDPPDLPPFDTERFWDPPGSPFRG